MTAAIIPLHPDRPLAEELELTLGALEQVTDRWFESEDRPDLRARYESVGNQIACHMTRLTAELNAELAGDAAG